MWRVYRGDKLVEIYQCNYTLGQLERVVDAKRGRHTIIYTREMDPQTRADLIRNIQGAVALLDTPALPPINPDEYT